MTRGLVYRRIAGLEFGEVAGNQVVKFALAESAERDREILLDRVEQAIEVHVGIDVYSLDGGEALVAVYQIAEPAARECRSPTPALTRRRPAP